MTLYEVRQVEIPLTIGVPRLAAHARRIAELTRLYTAALPGIPGGDLTAFADMFPLGVGISWARDLGVVGCEGAEVRRAVWPGSPDTARMAAALSADAPRYESWSYPGRCPLRGSRGGKCNERGRNRMQWVTDMETGEWEHREICDMHLPVARERLAAAPSPPPNRGGVLLAAFPDLNIPKFYQWARPTWTEDGRPAAEPAVGERPALRLVAHEPN